MTYSAVYCALITKRLQNPIEKGSGIYVEKHHIIPKSEGGSNEASNLVNLTAREHYVAHLLLAKIYNDQKMWCAIHRLVYGNKKNYTRITSRLYSTIRSQISRNQSEAMKGRTPPNKGKHPSEETKRKLSEAMKGRVFSEETKRKISDVKKSKPLSEEMRIKISEAHKGKPLTDEHRRKLSEVRKGKHLSEECRRKISEAHKGKSLSEETRKKMSRAKKGIILSEEHKRKISEANKGKHFSDETKRKLSEATKAYWAKRRAMNYVTTTHP